jgi:regulator of protease activity HflC (stomatin/prohibitin superfamily)
MYHERDERPEALSSRRRRFYTRVGLIALAGVIIVSVLGWFIFSNNAYTPAGYVGYVTQGSVFGKGHFVGLQRGPTSSGKKWLMNVHNISVTPYTYDEEFTGDAQVLSKDHMRVSFAVHVTFRVHPDKVQEFMEGYSTLSDDKERPEDIVKTAYKNYMKERLRTYARDEIQKYDWQQLTTEIGVIGSAVQEKILGLARNSPFDIQSVVVGNIQFPPKVAESVAEAQAASQVLARKEQEVKQAEAEARKKVAEAKGIAEAMDIVQKKLTPQYLQHEAIEAQKSQVDSANHTVIYIPVGPMGVPLTGTFEAASGGADSSTKPVEPVLPAAK